MDSKIHPDQIGGSSFHVGDCYIWAQIHYLDSATDYREYLPSCRPKRLVESDLLMLDDANSRLSLWAAMFFFGFAAVFIAIVAIRLGFLN